MRAQQGNKIVMLAMGARRARFWPRYYAGGLSRVYGCLTPAPGAIYIILFDS